MLGRGERRDASVGPPRGLAGDLRGAEDRRLVGTRHHRAVGRHTVPRRALTNPAGVKELHLVERRHEHAAVFDEERALLRKERLEHGEVQHGRILFDLAEVRVDGRRERGGRAEADAHVEASGEAELARRPRQHLLTHRRIRHELEPARRRRRLRKRQVAEARDKPLHAARRRHPAVELSTTVQIAADVEAPDRGLALRRWKAHLRKRNAQLREPASRRDAGGHVPHGVVVRALARVVVPRVVGLHAGRVDVEHICRAVVVPWIEADADDVARRKAVAPAERGHDLRGITREALHGEIQVAVVERNLHDRPLGGRLHAVGLVLHEIVDERGARPHLVVDPSIEPRHDAVDAERSQLLADLLRDVRLAGERQALAPRCGRRRQEDADCHDSAQDPRPRHQRTPSPYDPGGAWTGALDGPNRGKVCIVSTGSSRLQCPERGTDGGPRGLETPETRRR